MREIKIYHDPNPNSQQTVGYKMKTECERCYLKDDPQDVYEIIGYYSVEGMSRVVLESDDGRVISGNPKNYVILQSFRGDTFSDDPERYVRA